MVFCWYSVDILLVLFWHECAVTESHRIEKEWTKNGQRMNKEWKQKGHGKSTESLQKQFC